MRSPPIFCCKYASSHARLTLACHRMYLDSVDYGFSA